MIELDSFDLIGLVNKLVEDNFGKGFSGDVSSTKNLRFFFGWFRGENPDLIGRTNFLSWFPIGCRPVGFFKNHDPTQITIREEYAEQAEQYKQDYKAETGEEVSIRKVPDYKRLKIVYFERD